ncbi:MAG: hypothetical protein OEV43_02935 [Coriobacteriia bacterium]|nr:hypothetical protein [Coriobacteriia bacterium]
MLRGVWGGLRHRDEGFSVLEVVLAAFVLFFVLTAMLGLVGTTTRMNMNAQARNAVTNAVSSHIEWVRSLDFTQVGIRGSTPDATIEPQYTYTVDGYTILIENQIRLAADGTKELVITATASREGFANTTMTTFAAVRDKDEGLTHLVDLAAAPVLRFGTATPEENAVVFGSFQSGGSSLYVDAHAEAKHAGGYISDLRFYCSGELLRDGSTIFANVASWQPAVSPADQMFRWDTRQVNDSEESVIEDGWRVVRIIAIDDLGNEAQKDRRLYVDNYKPGNPGVPSAQIYDNTETRLSWAEAMDGTDPTAKYEVQVRQVLHDGSVTAPSSIIVSDPAYLYYGTSCSRYVATVRAGSPRNLWSDFVDMTHPFMTRALLTGTSTTVYAGRNQTRTSTTELYISVTPPNFGTTGVRYDLYRSTDPASMGDTPYKSDIGPTYNEVIVKTVGKFGVPDPWHYQYKITFVALGPGGGEEEVIWSNVAGPIAVSGTAPMGVALW